MDDNDSLERLQGLQADLVAFAESRLPNFERLWAELEDSIEDFKKLLDRTRKNDKSRQALQANKITIGGLDYGINEEFRQEVISVAEALDLDEIEAARLYIVSQESAQDLDRPAALTSILQFHARRETVLNSLRLVVQQAVDPDVDSEPREKFAEKTRQVVQGSVSEGTIGSTYWRKCVSSMEDIERWIRMLDEQLQRASIIGQTTMGYALEAYQYQRNSLLRQHESLGSVVCYMVKEGRATLDDYRFLMTKTAAIEKLDNIVVNYVPVLLSCAATFGPPDGVSTLRDARSLDQTFADTTDRTQWKLQDFRAATTTWWLAEYSGRYNEINTGSPLQGVDIEKESETRSNRFMEALRNGALQFMLLVCSKVFVDQWHDPAKAGLVGFLLSGIDYSRDVIITPTTDPFKELLAQQIQLFVESLIGNMPDTIRRLKFEEDEQRRNLGPSIDHTRQETTLHLERFLVVTSYAFQSFPEAALEAFWSDPDGNMYGFLQWASKRQTTPRVAAFCEMFQAIAPPGECADAAHKFLLDEAVSASSAKLRKGASLSWAQVFDELGYYATRLQDSVGMLSSQSDTGVVNQTGEPESALMLECYLRLASHMSRASASAREFILSHPSFHLHEVLFEFARSGIESRFKACAFDTLSALITDKTSDVSIGMWESLDQWIFGISPTKPNAPRTTTTQSGSDQAVSVRLRSIADGFEESNAFVQFLQCLIDPLPGQETLDDSLPFPEQLGLAYRMPGIDQYVDFAIESVMKGVLSDMQDVDQIWELRNTCLNFMFTCLATFNEDLVVFANSTSINVDTAISTSSLAAYVRLHPFSRIMEWTFNDGVISAIFATAHEDADAVSASSPGSPLIMALCRAVELINLVLNLQSTYLDIVRPIVKMQPAARSRQVANPALASFEDAILSNLNLVADLGLYCGTGHQHLTIASIRLLEKLALSKKLSTASATFSAGRPTASRILTALQQDNDVDRIAAAFIAPLQLNARELELGETAPGFFIKQAVLELLNSSLETSVKKPGLAHCLLGFICSDTNVTADPDGRFANGASLFHTVIRLYAETFALDESNELLWLSSIRRLASEVVRKLVKSSLTNQMVINELRESGFNDAVAVAQRIVPSNTLWCGRDCRDADFLLTESSAMFRNFLDERAAFFEHAALQLRSATERGAPTLRQKTITSLLGLTTLSSNVQTQNASVFDLFDFVDLDIISPYNVPSTKYMAGLDFAVTRKSGPEKGTEYDLRLARELLMLREAELRKDGQVMDAASLQQCRDEADIILACLQAQNQHTAIIVSQQAAVKAWVQLMTIILECGEFEPVQKSAFTLQALQIILPKLDVQLAQESPLTLPLAKLVYALLKGGDTAASSPSGRETNVANERLLHAFRSSLRGIASSSDSIDLRQTSYQIARHFLKTTATATKQSAVARQAVKAIEIAGERLVDTICEDALSSQGTCRIAALLMLEACVNLYQTVRLSHIVRTMTRLNFLVVLVDSIRAIPTEFQQERTAQDVPNLLAYIHSGLALLLRMAQDNEGATAILDAGLFSSVRDSRLFATDPDIGLDIDNPEALENFYQLLLSLLRIIDSIILVKGPRNDQILAQGRNFLLENRQCMQSIFKAASRSERFSEKSRQSLNDLVDDFVVLISATGFLEADEKTVGQRNRNLGFS